MDREPLLQYTGSFRLLRKIAEGGMAAVYEAEQLGPAGFQKRIALKVIHPHLAKREEFLQLFVDEAKLSGNLMHGNIVQIYQLGEVAGLYFIAMEYISGPTLRSVIDRHYEIGRPIPPALAAYIASRMCRALDFAHNFIAPDGTRLDIVHRDVSPGNVLLTWDGHVKLGDFGIAKAVTSVDPGEQREVRMGKKHYMSPEQVLGTAVDARSDVFAVGVVLYELLALSPLFHEDVTSLMVREVALDPLPNLRAHVTDLDRELEQILQSALHRTPSRRTNAAALGAALDGWIVRQNESASPDRLQSHLANLFPTQYAPPTREERTSFKNLKGAFVEPPRGTRSFLSRLFG